MRLVSARLLVLAAVGLVLLGCGGGRREGAYSGLIEADQLTVSAESNGQLILWDAPEGASVRAGQLLGLIDTAQLSLQRQALEQELRALLLSTPNVGRQIAALDAQLDALERERSRAQRLLAAEALPAKQLDDIKAQIATLDAQRNALLSQLNSASGQVAAQAAALRARIAQLALQMDKCMAKAPITGTIIQRYKERGELVGAGMPLCQIAKLDTVSLRAYLPYEVVTRLKLGEGVRVAAERGADSLAIYEGVVSWISEKAEFTPKMVQTREERNNTIYAVKVRIPNDGLLKVGMYAEMYYPK